MTTKTAKKTATKKTQRAKRAPEAKEKPKGIHIDEVAKEMNITVDRVKELADEHLEWLEDYYNVPGKWLHIRPSGIEKLKEVAGPAILLGVVHHVFPPNRHFIYIRFPGPGNRGICPVPGRYRQGLRQPGKRVRVIHVRDDIYRLADIPDEMGMELIENI